MTDSTIRLQETLGTPELARFVLRLRKRLEQGLPLSGCLTMTNVAAAERDAFNRLLGRISAGDHSLSIDLDLLEQRLGDAGVCRSLKEAVEGLTGPVTNRRSERMMIESKWESLFAGASAHLTSRPDLVPWLEQVRRQGLLRRHSLRRAETLLTQALSVIARLPARGVPLAELAASTTGNAHALDLNRPLGSLVIRTASVLGNVLRWDDAESRRDAWAALGVLLDELSAPVLVLNLRASGSHPVCQVLNIQAGAGEPCHLTLRQILRTPPTFTPGVTGAQVFVCENPNVVSAAANRLGAASAPLVCTEGHPRTTLRTLLNQLTQAGIRLRYHGDFDWPGIQIANTITSRHQATPWRMGASDYRRAGAGDFKLSGTPVVPAWDDGLLPAMLEAGYVIHEEQVLDDLMEDLEVPGQ
jgi:uncharacterized protein (TIGR02679 family)